MGTRNYANLSSRLLALKGPHLEVETIHSVEGYPMYLVHLRKSHDAPFTILLTAGVHGDEPAGVEAVLRFLDSEHAKRLDHFQFCVLPCINPTGVVENTRENRGGIDLNRAFDTDSIPEVLFVKEALNGRKIDCHFDFHEDWEARGFYMYEGAHDGQFFGDEIIDRVKHIGIIDPDDDEDDPPISPGVYPITLNWGTKGLAAYILNFHASHTIICETPTSWDMDQRVAAHLTALNTVMAHYLSQLRDV
jgi:hypothetical protein